MQDVDAGGEEKASSPEVSPASILTVLSINENINKPKLSILMYGNFVKTCNGAPIYLYFAKQLRLQLHRWLCEIESALFLIVDLVKRGQGTREPYYIERHATKVTSVYREAENDIEGRIENSVAGYKGESPCAWVEKHREETEKEFRAWMMEFFVSKMGSVMRDLDDKMYKGEVREMSEALKEVWAEKARMSERQVEELMRAEEAAVRMQEASCS